MATPESNPFKECRETCLGQPSYIQCYRNCLDKPTIDLVAKYFGAKSAEDCYGYQQMIVNAAYNFDPKFVAEAKRQGANTKYPDNLKFGTITGLGPMRNLVQEYFMMPKAPYPPRKDVAPIGVQNAKPDLKSIQEFFKKNPCYQKQLIAQACEANPGKCTPAFIEDAKKKLGLSGGLGGSVQTKNLTNFVLGSGAAFLLMSAFSTNSTRKKKVLVSLGAGAALAALLNDSTPGPRVVRPLPTAAPTTAPATAPTASPTENRFATDLASKTGASAYLAPTTNTSAIFQSKVG